MLHVLDAAEQPCRACFNSSELLFFRYLLCSLLVDIYFVLLNFVRFDSSDWNGYARVSIAGDHRTLITSYSLDQKLWYSRWHRLQFTIQEKQYIARSSSLRYGHPDLRDEPCSSVPYDASCWTNDVLCKDSKGTASLHRFRHNFEWQFRMISAHLS